MRLHLIALPHTRVSPEFNGCAYTAKALKFTKMMRAHEVILYAPEGSTSEHTAETVECLLDEDRQEIFGADDPGRLPGWPTFEQAAMFNSRAAEELGKRVRRGDLVLLTGGATHLPIMEQVEALYCEPGVGYEGIATGLCAFESHAWRHYVYAKRGIADGRWFDAVIPNYFDLSEFPVPASGSRDYLVYLGRIVPRKGPHIAAEIAQHAGLPLLVAGAGDVESGDGWLVANKGTPDEVRLEGAVTYLGPVTVEERATLLAGARALLAPTLYIEPFGGVAVEAMLCGTPAITSDWGAFPETVEQAVTGYRFATLAEGVEAVRQAEWMSNDTVRARTASRFSLEAVAPLFERWFERLTTLYGRGWYEMAAPAAIMRG